VNPADQPTALCTAMLLSNATGLALSIPLIHPEYSMFRANLTALNYTPIIRDVKTSRKFRYPTREATVKKIVPVIAVFILASGAYDIGAQKLYTWTDAQGVTHITDDPPPRNASLENVTVYPAKNTQEIDAIERKKQQMRQDYKQFEEREASRRAEIEARQAQQQAQEAIQKVQQETEDNQEYIRRLSSTKQKRRQFRKKIERIKNETEAAQAEAKKAEEEADAAVKKADQAASGANVSQ
jgi:hypothetical protein